MRRMLCAFLAAALLPLGGVAACTSDKRVTRTAHGVTVDARVSGDLAITQVAVPSSLPPRFKPVGGDKAVRIDGDLKGEATVTFSYPANEAPEAFTVLRHHDGMWTHMFAVADTAKHTLTVRTSKFSEWTLSRWDVEQAVSQGLANLRDYLSSDGLPILSNVGKIAANPPIEECRFEALTLTVDAAAFIKRAERCVKFAPDAKDGTPRKWRLYISNTQYTPYMVRLPKGARVATVRPTPSNPVTSMLSTVQRLQLGQVAFLPAGGQVMVEIDPEVMRKEAVATATVDVVTPVLDVGMALIDTLMPMKLSDRTLIAIKGSAEIAKVVSCVWDQAAGYSLNKATPLQILTKLPATMLLKCTEALAALAVHMVATEMTFQAVADSFNPMDIEQFRLVKGVFTARIKMWLSLWNNASVPGTVVGAFTELAANGFKKYRLVLKPEVPPLSQLNTKAFPGDESGFVPERYQAPTDQLPFGYFEPCTGKNDWNTWMYSTAPERRYSDGEVASTVKIGYAKPEYIDELATMVTDMIGADSCEADGGRVGRVKTEFQQINVGPVRPTTLMATRTVNTDSDFGAGMPYPQAYLFDKATGMFMVVTAMAVYGSDSWQPGKQSPAAVAELERVVHYMAPRADVQLGTSFTNN